MTFRINSVSRRRDAWEFSVKGVEGKGVYGILRTSNTGNGLILLSAPEHDERVLFSEDDFHIPDSSNNIEAGFMVVSALIEIGWGPEVDNEHYYH